MLRIEGSYGKPLSNATISLLESLVKIPSICGDEYNIAEFTRKWLVEHGLSAEMTDVKPRRPNVVCRLKGRKEGPGLLLNGHMDTVAVGGGWTRDPFGAEIEGERMYGRGTIDMKSGLAAILVAATECMHEGLPEKGELIVTAVVDEESIDLGTYALIQQGVTKGVDLAMVSEATDLNVVNAHRGRTVFDIEVRGRAAHSMWPEHGVSAIEGAARLITELPELYSPNHPRLGRDTMNVLKIEGGQEDVMLVPEHCRMVVDRCLVPGDNSKNALDALNHLIKTIGVDASAKLIFRETPFCEPFEISENDERVRIVTEAATKVLGRRPKLDYHPGPCDSCILVTPGGIPTLEFGPSGGRLHESDEFVELNSVRKTTEVYKEVIRAMLS
ncbi:MAG TPA: M20 family metallopeptidase [Terriglobales bacterium]|nr:M20 family metallopeptidase [Terriglobales bacterium]